MNKNKRSKFMTNVIILMVSQLVVKLFGIIYKLYLTNKNGFGDIGNAIYGAAFQVYALFLSIASTGMPNAISSITSKKLSQGNNKGAYRVFKVAFSIFGSIGFVLSLILYVFSSKIANIYLNMPETEEVLKILSTSIFLVSIEAVLKGFFNGREKMSYTAHSQSLEQIVKAISTIVMVEIIARVSDKNTVLMVQAAAIAIFTSNAVSVLYLMRQYIIVRKNVYIDINTSAYYKKERLRNIIENIFRIAIPISLSTMLSLATKTIDTFTIIRIGEKVVGYDEIKLQYGILSGKVETLISLPYSFNIAIATTLIPTITALKEKNDIKSVKIRIKKSIFATILIGLPISICMSVFSDIILKILFPNASLGAELLKISAWNIIIVVLIQTVNGALQGLGIFKMPVIALSIGGILKLILNLILIRIPNLGIKGAIISTIMSQLMTLIICLITLKKAINSINLKKQRKKKGF